MPEKDIHDMCLPGASGPVFINVWWFSSMSICMEGGGRNLKNVTRRLMRWYTESQPSSVQGLIDWLIDWLYQSLTAHQHQKGHTVPKQVSPLK